jgi:hypothetical protein
MYYDYREEIQADIESERNAVDTYHQSLDVILETFPKSPEAMAAVVMKFFDGLSIGAKAISFPIRCFGIYLVAEERKRSLR